MKKCDCYHEEKKKEKYSDLTRGIILAKTGKLPKEDYHEVIDARCWGTPECERCKCGGDRTKCDFYPEVREKAKNQTREEQLNQKVTPTKELVQSKDKDEILKHLKEIIGTKSTVEAANTIYEMFLGKE